MVEKYSLKRDALYSLIPISILLGVYVIFNVNLINLFGFSLKDTTSIMIGLFGSLVGFVITVITILLMFDYKDNENLNKIKKAGLYNQIFERYMSTLIVLFGSLIGFISIYFTTGLISLNGIVELIVRYVMIFTIILSTFRIYRNIKLLKKILEII